MTDSSQKMQRFFQARQSAVHHTVIDQVDALSQLLLGIYDADFIAVFYQNEAHEVLLPVTYQTVGNQPVAALDELEKRWLVKLENVNLERTTVFDLSSEERPGGTFDEFGAANSFSGCHHLPVSEDGELKGVIVLYWLNPKTRLPAVPDSQLNWLMQILTQAVSVIRHIGTMDRFLMRLSVLAELFETDLNNLQLPDAFREIVRTAHRLVPLSAVGLMARDVVSGDLGVLQSAGDLARDEEFRQRLVDYAGLHINAYDLPKRPDTAAAKISIEGRHPYSEIVAFEVAPEAKYCAVIVICSRRVGGFTDIDRDLMSVFVSFATVLLDNAVLVKNLRKANSMIRESSDRLADSEAMAALTDMTSGIAHRLNNVIGALAGRLQLMQLKADDDDVRHKLADLEGMALEAAATVKRVQEFATCTRSSAPMKSLDLVELLTGYRDSNELVWRSPAREKGIDVQFDLPAAETVVAGVDDELQNVLDHLLLNAVEFAFDDSLVTVELATTDYHVELSVTNEGPTIPPEMQRKIYYPFFSTKRSRDAGMGLAIVHSILTRHGARLDITSSDDITRITAVFERPESVQDTGKVLQAEGPTYRDLNFLVADDDRQLREVVRDMLVLDGHEVTLCSDGYTALERLGNKHYDVLITDLGMPGMSGLELAGMAHETHPNMPIIMITGWGTQLKEEEVAIRGIKAVLSKPFHLRDIKRLVSQVMAE